MNRVIFTLAFLSAINASYAAEANHDAATYDTAESCALALSSIQNPDITGSLSYDEISLLSWNIEKGLNTGWQKDLDELSRQVQLVLLQEAVFIDEMKQSINEAVFWSFSPGYQSRRFNSGIMTLSRAQPDLICSLKKTEPWLNIPKIASITRYKFDAAEQPLLLVNIHQINFTLGNKAFRGQLQEVADLMALHEGPIIFSGDFNTWKNSRLTILNQLTQELELTPVAFVPDNRKTMFGHQLDHVFTRGFIVKNSQIIEVETSDHNPLLITLSLEGA